MLGKLRPRSIYDVMAAIACFGVLAGGTAYAANTIGSPDVIDESLLSEDIKNGQVRWDDVGPNAVGSSRVFDETLLSQDIKNGQVKWDDVAPNAVGSSRVHDETLLSQDVKNDTLTGADINEGSLVGGPGSPSGAAGGDLTGSYPNPQIQDRAIGARHLKSLLAATHDSAVIPAGGTTGSAGNEPDVRAQCPEGTFALTGGGYWDFNSGQISGIRHFQSGILVNGTNRGTAEQTLHAFAYCLPY